MCEYLGSESYMYFDFASKQLIAKIPARFPIKGGESHAIALDPHRFYIFDKESENTIVFPTSHHKSVK